MEILETRRAKVGDLHLGTNGSNGLFLQVSKYESLMIHEAEGFSSPNTAGTIVGCSGFGIFDIVGKLKVKDNKIILNQSIPDFVTNEALYRKEYKRLRKE